MELQLSSIIKYAWATYKKHWKVWAILVSIILIINAISITFGHHPATTKAPAYGFVWVDVITFIVSFVLTILVIKTAIAHIRDEKISLGTVLQGLGWRQYLYYVLASLLMVLGVLVGLIFFIIPGVILTLAWIFTLYLILDQKSGIIESFKRSYHLTYGHKWDVLGLVFLMIVINILGALAFIVGLFISLPITYLAQARMYDLYLSGASSHKDK
ncbi:MAG: hypothetical protein ACKKL4_01360 [Patescibacteria group bacterium]